MRINSRRMSVVAGIVCVAFLLGGCASLIAPEIVAPQRTGLQGALVKSRGGRFMLEDLDAYISTRRRVAVGPPPARLSVAVVPPGDYSLTFSKDQRPGCATVHLGDAAQVKLSKALDHLCLVAHHLTVAQAKRRFPAGGKAHLNCPLRPLPPAVLRHYRASVARLRGAVAPKGTVILLPGYGVGKLSMLPWALLLGRAGYQSILVDLRAQGQSTGRHVTYGALESRDLVQLVAALRKTGLTHGRLGLLGDSMGAATALLAAPHIPDLAAVVAISPYGRATTVIRRYARAAYWYARFIPAAAWRAAERKAGRIAGMSLAEAAPINAVVRIRAPVLYLQGGRDHVVGLKAARGLAARTPDSHLRIYPKLGHLQLSTAFAQLARPVIEWYNRYLARDRRQVTLAGKRPKVPPSVSFHICVHL